MKAWNHFEIIFKCRGGTIFVPLTESRQKRAKRLRSCFYWRDLILAIDVFDVFERLFLNVRIVNNNTIEKNILDDYFWRKIRHICTHQNKNLHFKVHFRAEHYNSLFATSHFLCNFPSDFSDSERFYEFFRKWTIMSKNSEFIL